MEKGLYDFKAVLRLASAALIGCGAAETTDMDVLRDVDGIPYIPATTMAGVLRHLTADQMDKKTHTSIWGTLGSDVFGQADSQQSAVTVYDILPVEPKKIKTQIRDGIRLDPKTGIVADAAKFDHEVIEPGAMFVFRMQIRYGSFLPQDEACRCLALVHALFFSGGVFVGARTTNGLGRLEYSDNAQPSVSHYASGLSPRDRLDWLLRKPRPLSKEEVKRIFEKTDFNIHSVRAQIRAQFRVRRSIIVRSYPGAPELPDAVQLKSGTDYVVPGSSLKGAIRSRAVLCGICAIMTLLLVKH